ncbi:hypothetical protein PVK06_049256 [Gossypium arboreum]|uniref:Uncharacterized protein n=1 Tax=Gossypium arboreum TaxID=29729 RepID=A0ABR0MKS5_GOSAR|nr:hypothetical protein PVK06_049256 [Gossypium arboreum]
MDFLCENPRSGDVSMEDLIPKKVRFREEGGIGSGEVLPNVPIKSTASWKDKLVGISSIVGNGLKEKEDFELLDGDFYKSIVNGTPSIEFSKRINQILVKDMENTVVLKLLGCNIGFLFLKIKSIVYGSRQGDVLDHTFGIARLFLQKENSG